MIHRDIDKVIMKEIEQNETVRKMYELGRRLEINQNK